MEIVCRFCRQSWRKDARGWVRGLWLLGLQDHFEILLDLRLVGSFVLIDGSASRTPRTWRLSFRTAAFLGCQPIQFLGIFRFQILSEFHFMLDYSLKQGLLDILQQFQFRCVRVVQEYMAERHYKFAYMRCTLPFRSSAWPIADTGNGRPSIQVRCYSTSKYRCSLDWLVRLAAMTWISSTIL